MSEREETPRQFNFRQKTGKEISKSASIHNVLSVLTGETPENIPADIEFGMPIKDLGKDVPKLIPNRRLLPKKKKYCLMKMKAHMSCGPQNAEEPPVAEKLDLHLS